MRIFKKKLDMVQVVVFIVTALVLATMKYASTLQ